MKTMAFLTYFMNDCSLCVCENSKYAKSVVNNSVIVRGEVINDEDSVATNVTNTIPAYVMSTVSINSTYKKVICEIDHYILNTLLLLTILLFMIAIF